jgi:tetratricopeptide (TPR) repeat protein
VTASTCLGQDTWKEGIDRQLALANHDTSHVLAWAELGNYYKYKKPDSGLFYLNKALALARQIEFARGQVEAMLHIAVTQITLGNEANALRANLQANKIAEKNKLIEYKVVLLVQLGIIYYRSQNYKKALSSFRETMKLADLVHDSAYYALAQTSMGETYLELNQLDSALNCSQLAYNIADKIADKIKVNWLLHDVRINLGKIYSKKGNPDLALKYFHQSLQIAGEDDKIIASNFAIAQLYEEADKPDSSIYYAEKAFELAEDGGFYSNGIDASMLLSDIYEDRDPTKALKYNKAAIAFKDSLYNQGRTLALENLTAFDEQERQYEIETAKANYRNQVRQYVLIAGFLVFLLIVFLLYRNIRHKEKSKVKIEKAYESLKSTQTQLIQSEKMASLGELTAGIAHEIQNPLNFVNNFSEVNRELIERNATRNE